MKTKKVKGIKIVSRYNPEKVIFQSSKTTMKEAVEEAIKDNVCLSGSDFKDCDLRGSDLRDCDFRNSDFSFCDLRDCDLSSCDLRDCETSGCVVNFISSEYKQAKQFVEGLK